MAGHKIDRITEDVKRELTAILREVKDPRVNQCFLSIVRVEVTNDLSYCTVYVSTMEGLEQTKKAAVGLRSAAGFIRRELGRKLSLRHVPELIFKPTDSIAYGADISQKLMELEREDAKKAALRGELPQEEAEEEQA
jgi:ribosome-binding factor A